MMNVMVPQIFIADFRKVKSSVFKTVQTNQIIQTIDINFLNSLFQQFQCDS